MRPTTGMSRRNSRLAVDQELRSSQRWEAARVPFLWVCGSSQAEAWKQFSKFSQQSMGVLIRAN